MEFRIGDTFTDSLGEEHPCEPGDRRPGQRGWANPHTLLAGRVVWRRCMRSTLLITRSTWPTSPRRRSRRSPAWGRAGAQRVGAAADFAARNWFMGDQQGHGEEHGST
jgi:hypothetical protein